MFVSASCDNIKVARSPWGINRNDAVSTQSAMSHQHSFATHIIMAAEHLGSVVLKRAEHLPDQAREKKGIFTSCSKPGMNSSLCSESNMKQHHSLVPWHFRKHDFQLFPLENVCICTWLYVNKHKSLIWNMSFIDTSKSGRTFLSLQKLAELGHKFGSRSYMRLDHILALVAVTTLPWCLAS